MCHEGASLYRVVPIAYNTTDGKYASAKNPQRGFLTLALTGTVPNLTVLCQS